MSDHIELEGLPEVEVERRLNGEPSAETAESIVRDALLAELADEHGCYVEDESTGRLLACRPCAERATRLAARLAHERLVCPPGLQSGGDPS